LNSQADRIVRAALVSAESSALVSWIMLLMVVVIGVLIALDFGWKVGTASALIVYLLMPYKYGP